MEENKNEFVELPVKIKEQFTQEAKKLEVEFYASIKDRELSDVIAELRFRIFELNKQILVDKYKLIEQHKKNQAELVTAFEEKLEQAKSRIINLEQKK